MSNLTADTIHETRPRAGRVSFVVDNGVTLFAGSFVGTDASGFLDKWAATAGHRFAGLLLEGSVGDSSGSPVPEGRVDTSGVTLKGATVASLVQGSVNALVYCETDNPADMDLSASANVDAIGWCSRFISAGVGDVTLFTPEEYLARNDLGAVTALTDSTGDSGTHSDTLADGLTATNPAAITSNAITDSSGGTASTSALAVVDEAMVAINGSGMTTAQEAEYNGTVAQLNDNIATVNAELDLAKADLVAVRTAVLALVTDTTTQNQNDSNLAQKVNEILSQ